MGGVDSVDGNTVVNSRINSSTGRLLTDATGGGTGTVTTVSVVSANGFAGTVANATTTPAITLTTTITGILQGNGTAISAATTTGSGSVVLATSPTLVTPALGVATATSITSSGALYSATSLVLEETGAGTDTITIQAASSIAASLTWTLPVDNGSGTQFLSNNGSGTLSWSSPSGSGDVVGPGSATDNAAARFDGTTGKLIQNSLLIIADTTGNISGFQAATFTGTSSGTVIVTAPAAAGSNTLTLPAATDTLVGKATTDTFTNKTMTASSNVLGAVTMTLGSDATGDTYYRSSGTVLTRLGIGNTGDVLTVAAGLPSWAAPAAAVNITVANEATDTTCFPVFVTAATGSLPPKTNAGLTFNSNTASLGATLMTATTSLTSASILASSNGSGSIGASGTAFSNLFLASAGVINWAAGNATLTHSTGLLTSNVPFSVGTSNAITAGTIELGAATDTTIARVSAGVISVEGITVDTASNTLTLSNKTLTAPIINASTITGINSYSAGATQQFAVPTSDGTATGPTTASFNSSYTSAIGDLVYLTTSGTWALTDADALATTTGLLGIALAVATNGNPLLVALPGAFVYATAFPTLTIGAPYYVGETAGTIQATIPTGADNAVRVVGFGFHADKLFFNPSSDTSTTVA